MLSINFRTGTLFFFLTEIIKADFLRRNIHSTIIHRSGSGISRLLKKLSLEIHLRFILKETCTIFFSFSRTGDYMPNTSLQVPDAVFSMDGLDVAKFVVNWFERFLLVVVDGNVDFTRNYIWQTSIQDQLVVKILWRD